MNCLDCQTLLHDRLDGKPTLRTPDLDEHLAQCAGCRELFGAVRLLSEGLLALPKPQPGEGLTGRIVAAALRDRKLRVQRMHVRVYVTAALGASILVLLFSGYLLPTTKKHDRPEIVQKDPPAPAPQQDAPPTLVTRADDARQAVAQLTERVAGQTRDQAKLLLAMANPLELPSIATWPVLSELDEPLDPAAKSLREATQSVAAPMARTARGAWNLFMKELPVFDIGPSN